MVDQVGCAACGSDEPSGVSGERHNLAGQPDTYARDSTLISHPILACSTPDALRAYLTQARQETVVRLVERVYDAQSGGRPSKWWMAFQVSSHLISFCCLLVWC